MCRHQERVREAGEEWVGERLARLRLLEQKLREDCEGRGEDKEAVRDKSRVKFIKPTQAWCIKYYSMEQKYVRRLRWRNTKIVQERREHILRQ